MKTWFISALAALSISTVARASELDASPTAKNPTGLVVRTDAQGNQTLFQLPVTVTNEAEARAAVEKFATAANSVQVHAASELDQGSSQAAWYYGWNGYNYGYGYGYGYNACNWYYPTYSWGGYGGYNWGFWGGYAGYGYGGYGYGNRGWW
jgi:hypothetical protein